MELSQGELYSRVAVFHMDAIGICMGPLSMAGKFNRTNAVWMFMTAIMVCILGCAPFKSEEPVPAAPPRYFQHKVSSDAETLSAIALWYTGDVKNWRTLFARTASGKITHLRTGDEILIPENLVIRTEAIPEHLLRRTAKRNKSNLKERPNARSQGAVMPEAAAEPDVEEEAADEAEDARRAEDEFLHGLIESSGSSSSAAPGRKHP